MLPLTKLVRSVSRGFRGEDGAVCDLAEWPAERVCDLTRSSNRQS